MHVVAVCREPTHGFSKRSIERIELVAGRGVMNDAHCGETVRHIFDRRRNATKPNLRQVHLLEAELIKELQDGGFLLDVGDLGENIVTHDLALDALSAETRLHLGDEAVLCVTGLRAPCAKDRPVSERLARRRYSAPRGRRARHAARRHGRRRSLRNREAG